MKSWPLLAILIAICAVAWMAPSAMAASSTTDMMKNGKTIVSTDMANNYSPPSHATLAGYTYEEETDTTALGVWASGAEKIGLAADNKKPVILGVYGKDQTPIAGASIITSGYEMTAIQDGFASKTDYILASLGNAQTEVGQTTEENKYTLKTDNADGNTTYAWVALNDSSGGGIVQCSVRLEAITSLKKNCTGMVLT